VSAPQCGHAAVLLSRSIDRSCSTDVNIADPAVPAVPP
jgi:hypothetical protein